MSKQIFNSVRDSQPAGKAGCPPIVVVDDGDACLVCYEPLINGYTYYSPQCGGFKWQRGQTMASGHVYYCEDCINDDRLLVCVRCNQEFDVGYPVTVRVAYTIDE